MVIKVHGSPISTATLRALSLVHEKQLEHEFVTVDMASGVHKKQPYLSLNPFGQVPALEDGDIKIFESRAITKYLAYNYESKGSQLIHKSGKELAAFSIWLEVEAHQFDPVASKLAWELVYKSKFGMETDKATVEENETKLAKVLDVYEVRLTESKYLAGDSFSLADLHHQPVLHYLVGTQVKKLFDERAHFSAWLKAILARPAWEKATSL